MALVVVTIADDAAEPAGGGLVLAWPPRQDAAGRPVYVQQGSLEELAQAARLVLETRLGERKLTAPGYGRKDWLHGQDVDPADVQAALTEWEPRITSTVEVTRTGIGDVLIQVEITPAEE